jgi:hypothetical protein
MYSVKSGATKSCGCYIAKVVKLPRSHGGSTLNGSKRNPTYNSWAKMKDRCYNENNTQFDDYGGRGIKVCHRWHKYENFLADMGERPKGTTIDRYPNKDGDYKKSNCRWATKSQQQNNLRTNITYFHQGKQRTRREIYNLTKPPVSFSGFIARLNYGWSIHEATTLSTHTRV